MKQFFIKLAILTFLVLFLQLLFLIIDINSFDQLKALEKAKEEKVNVIYLGDSSASNYDLDDSDKRPLPQMIQEILDDYTLTSIDHAAYAAEMFLEFSKYMVRENYHPEFVVIPINIRSFSPSWDRYPGYQFEEEKAILKNKLLFMFLKTIEAFDKDNSLSEISQSEFENTDVLNGKEVVGKAKDFEGHEFRNYSEENMMKSILVFYMFSLNQDHRKLESLSQIAKILTENNIKPIFYITPIDYETGEKYFPNQFLERLKENTETIKSVLKKNDVEVLDLSNKLSSDFFGWEKYPNEHLNEKGRKYVAKKIAGKISGYQEKSSEECKKYDYYQCPEGCTVCPPCEVCSSISCNSREFCESIGFDQDWYEMIELQREKTK